MATVEKRGTNGEKSEKNVKIGKKLRFMVSFRLKKRRKNESEKPIKQLARPCAKSAKKRKETSV